MAERFGSVSEDELCRLFAEKDSKNTKRATKASVKVFNEYLQEKNLDEPHYDDKVTLANVLTRFYAEARWEPVFEKFHDFFTIWTQQAFQGKRN